MKPTTTESKIDITANPAALAKGLSDARSALGQFQCDNCRGWFDKSSDEEAVAEYLAAGADCLPAVCPESELVNPDTGFEPDEAVSLLCDDCYERFMAWWRAEGERKYGADCLPAVCPESELVNPDTGPEQEARTQVRKRRIIGTPKKPI